ncbi:hypothetical protein AURANDRAFT_67711 [Aureococcus anophagefferens]|uniref:Uncharacterized protein n=1 Tax=Aureococcus anophagefferens TaxID=44056 RepID=F0YM50_AURAN|nr:hypothetical protein AURANDRAFT_67711 [Aureococcus anophagefferens]EGB03827.1 hypothetical protein AURANDRAFT_67711 [Aureococcus anophagefferens]|eukprot:XP_009041485.1 hypothetical protein AURANDRAFT_67711 [Aureococcus anophagefferens]
MKKAQRIGTDVKKVGDTIEKFDTNYKKVTNFSEVDEEHQDHLDISAAAYDGTTPEGYTKHEEHSNSEFHVFENDETGDIHIGYKGTDPTHIDDLIADGHSLGGNIALWVEWNRDRSGCETQNMTHYHLKDLLFFRFSVSTFVFIKSGQFGHKEIVFPIETCNKEFVDGNKVSWVNYAHTDIIFVSCLPPSPIEQMGVLLHVSIATVPDEVTEIDDAPARKSGPIPDSTKGTSESITRPVQWVIADETIDAVALSRGQGDRL